MCRIFSSAFSRLTGNDAQVPQRSHVMPVCEFEFPFLAFYRNRIHVVAVHPFEKWRCSDWSVEELTLQLDLRRRFEPSGVEKLTARAKPTTAVSERRAGELHCTNAVDGPK